MFKIFDTPDGQVALDPARVRRIESYRGDTIVFYDEDEYADRDLIEVKVAGTVRDVAVTMGLAE